MGLSKDDRVVPLEEAYRIIETVGDGGRLVKETIYVQSEPVGSTSTERQGSPQQRLGADPPECPALALAGGLRLFPDAADAGGRQ